MIRFGVTCVLATLCLTAIRAEDEFEKSAFLDAEGEAAMEGAIAFGYAQFARIRDGSVVEAGMSTTVHQGDRMNIGCGSATVEIGTTTVMPGNDATDAIDSNTVVIGDVTSVNLGCD